MREKSNKKPELHALCVAVKRVRTTAGLSQERFAREYGIATQTVSRFERGIQVPVDSLVLRRLHLAALNAGLPTDANLFWEAILPDPFDRERQPWEFYPTERVYTLQEW